MQSSTDRVAWPMPTRPSANSCRRTDAPNFEGYWENEAADQSKLRNGWYWTGDLAYKDAAGFLWFAGRAGRRLRVDGRTLRLPPRRQDPAAPSRRRHGCRYAIPDPSVGDQVMTAIQLRPGAEFDGKGFGRFLAKTTGPRAEVGPPVRTRRPVLPTTATAKILVRQLAGPRPSNARIRVGIGLHGAASLRRPRPHFERTLTAQRPVAVLVHGGTFTSTSGTRFVLTWRRRRWPSTCRAGAISPQTWQRSVSRTGGVRL